MKILYANIFFQFAKSVTAKNDELLNILDYYNFKTENNDTYLHFMPHILHHQPKNTIIYLLETDEAFHNCVLFHKNLTNAKKIYDFSPSNARKMREFGYDVEYRPVLYHPSYINKIHPPKPMKDREIDVLFLGTVNHRRLRVLNLLTTRSPLDLKLLIVKDNCFDDDLEKVMSNTKVCLCLNQFDNGGLSALRVVPFVTNKVRMLCEHTSDVEMDDFYNDTVDWIYPHHLEDADTFHSFIKNIVKTTSDNLVQNRHKNLLDKGVMTPLPDL